jgi:hypothetical protein
MLMLFLLPYNTDIFLGASFFWHLLVRDKQLAYKA